MPKLKSLLSLSLILLTSVAALAADEYRIDPNHSSAGFAVKHLLVSTVKGRFTQVTGTILLDETNLANSAVNAVIKTASITTDNDRRDTHLRSDAFFDVQKYPDITFQSTRIEKTADGYVAVGNLTIKDVTREVRLPFTYAKGESRGTMKLGVDTGLQINRFDYHVAYDPSGATVGKDVKIEINLEANKAAAADASKGAPAAPPKS